jgi:hypothetical protein
MVPQVWTNRRPSLYTHLAHINNTCPTHAFYLHFVSKTFHIPLPYTLPRLTASPDIVQDDLLKKTINMSLLLPSIRTITHPSLTTGAPALLIRTSQHLTPTLLPTLGLRSFFSAAIQKPAPKAVPQKCLASRVLTQQRTQQIHTLTLVAKNLSKSPVRSRTPQGFLARRVREQQRIHQMYIQQAYDQKLDRLARSTLDRWDSGWSSFFFRSVITVSMGFGIRYYITEIRGEAPQEMDEGRDELSKLYSGIM